VRQRVLGGTGISVSDIALGTMMFGAMGNTDHDESIVGKALKGRRDDVVLATKFGLPRAEDLNYQGGSPRWIKRAVENSLRRLDTDHIDLYQMHRFDPLTDIDETLGASRRRCCRPRAPQAFDLSVPANKAKLEAVDALTKLAADAGMPLTHLAIAFVRSHPAVTAVLIGPRTPSHLGDLLAGADVELTGDVLDRIDEIVAPGTEINPTDTMFVTPPAIADKRLRRR